MEFGAEKSLAVSEFGRSLTSPIGFPDTTPALGRESGFLGVVDLLKVAKHGKGENIYLIRFHYGAPRKHSGQSNFA